MTLQNKFSFPNFRSDIVLIGEILVDRIHDETLQNTVEVFGGSTANITLNLTSLEVNPHFFGTVGSDEIGTSLKNELIRNKVDITHVRTVKKDTTIVEIDKASGTPVPKFIRSSDYHIYWTPEMESELKNTKILHFSYWPLSSDPARSTILKALEVAKENNVLVGFDPNYHIDLDLNKGNDIEFIKSILKDIDIIKPSLDDSMRIFGTGLTKVEYLKKFQDFGCEIVIMTLGKDGLIAGIGDEIIELPSMATEIVDATGAGDAFWSGLYSGIIHDETLINSIRIGLLCSAYNLKNIGSHCDFPKYLDIKKILGI
ncbi:MAG: carbohydrate kinase [Firmicutes bacterium]|nr:carbohydrate kinase [Bacillota bacterium]